MTSALRSAIWAFSWPKGRGVVRNWLRPCIIALGRWRKEICPMTAPMQNCMQSRRYRWRKSWDRKSMCSIFVISLQNTFQKTDYCNISLLAASQNGCEVSALLLFPLIVRSAWKHNDNANTRTQSQAISLRFIVFTSPLVLKAMP